MERFGRCRRVVAGTFAAFANCKTVARDVGFNRVFRVVRFVFCDHNLRARHDFRVVAHLNRRDVVSRFARIVDGE